MKIVALIERSNDKYYSITSGDEVMNHCFGGYGYSVSEAKDDFYKSIAEAKEMIIEDGYKIPDYFIDNEVVFRYDIPSFFNAFDWINVSAFAKRVGINESKMRAYKSGLASASERTALRILSAIRSMGAELSAVTL